MQVTLYYDGECPFCNRYAEILKLKKCANLSVVDARVDLSWKEYARDIKLDDGVIIRVNSSYFQGVEAVDMLLSICNFKGLFFTIQNIVFANNFVGNLVYTLFKIARKIALWIKRVPSE